MDGNYILEIETLSFWSGGCNWWEEGLVIENWKTQLQGGNLLVDIGNWEALLVDGN